MEQQFPDHKWFHADPERRLLPDGKSKAGYTTNLSPTRSFWESFLDEEYIKQSA
jgi:hypothetical protein